MSIEEKIAQLTSIFVDDLIENGDFSEAKAEQLIKHGIGQISRVAGSKLGFKPREVAKIVNKIQKFLIEKTRLGIPAIVHEECLSGLMGPSVVMFPIPLALASTWDPDLVKNVAEKIREQALLVGVKHCLSPVLDLCRDPRWGRCEETFGEDHNLVAAMGIAYVRGLQGDGDRVYVVATAKHFAAHGVPEGGRNIASVNIGVREFRNIHLYPFEAVVKLAKLKSVMPAYHEIDGIPCHANDELLSKILRYEWGFDGIVVSDYWGVRMLNTVHRVAKSCKEAAILALSAGVDIELPHNNCFKELVEAVRKREIPEELLDRGVERVLYVKYLLGLFDNPYVDEARVPETIDGPSYRELAREVARKSIVLLKNDGVLPLPKSNIKIAVIGPLADNPFAMLGDYHYASHIGLVQPDIHIVTVLEGIRNKIDPSSVSYAKGCEVQTSDLNMLNEAIAIASKADVVVIVIGDISCIFDKNRCTSGEGIDRTDLSLTKPQEELVKSISNLGKPVVLVVVAGRPMSLENVQKDVKAILWCWKLGAEGGNAIADILFGDYSPSGRLPVSLPRSSGQLPIYYSRRPSSFGEYIEMPSKPLYPFGYGLSYTEFRYTSINVEPLEVPIAGEIRISVEVENIGGYEADEVVQIYIARTYNSLALPVKELKAFKRIKIKPGERRRVTFKIPTQLLAFYNRDTKLVIEPGEYKVVVGRNSEESIFETTIKIVGETIELKERKIFTAEAYIE
ncbi:MAG: glycoside hydrolase family 3 N-terminal domain-containing protein [Ignisphaera sp.]